MLSVVKDLLMYIYTSSFIPFSHCLVEILVQKWYPCLYLNKKKRLLNMQLTRDVPGTSQALDDRVLDVILKTRR